MYQNGNPTPDNPVSIEGNIYFENMNKQAKCCPVCCGKGFVDRGFYNSTKSTWISSTAGTETCRSCKGKGYVVI